MAAQGDHSGKDKKEGQHDEGEEDYESDDSDSDEHSGSGSSSDDDDDQGSGEGHAFDLDLPMEGINEAKAMVTSEGDLEAGGERHVNGELGTTEGAKEECDATNEVHTGSEEEGEDIPLLMEHQLSQQSARPPSPPQPLDFPPLPLSPPPPEEAPCAKEEGSHNEDRVLESDAHLVLDTCNTTDAEMENQESTIEAGSSGTGEETVPGDSQTLEGDAKPENDGAPQAELTPPLETSEESSLPAPPL